MDRKEKFFADIAAVRILVPMVVFLLIIESVFIFYLTPGFMEASGGGGILDMSVAYPPEIVREFTLLLDRGGLSWYNRIQILDFIFPLVYGLFISALLYRIYRCKYTDFSRYFWIIIIPLLGACFDYLENLGIRGLIMFRPESLAVYGRVLSLFSTLKFLALAGSVLFMLSGIGYFIKGRRDAFKK